MHDNFHETVFLVAMLTGTAALVAGNVITRMNWRPSLPAYSRRTRSIDVLLHPARYTASKHLGLIRALNLFGLLLITLALVTLLGQAARQFLR